MLLLWVHVTVSSVGENASWKKEKDSRLENILIFFCFTYFLWTKCGVKRKDAIYLRDGNIILNYDLQNIFVTLFIFSDISTTASCSSCPWPSSSWRGTSSWRTPSGPRARTCPGTVELLSLTTTSRIFENHTFKQFVFAWKWNPWLDHNLYLTVKGAVVDCNWFWISQQGTSIPIQVQVEATCLNAWLAKIFTSLLCGVFIS